MQKRLLLLSVCATLTLASHSVTNAQTGIVSDTQEDVATAWKAPTPYMPILQRSTNVIAVAATVADKPSQSEQSPVIEVVAGGQAISTVAIPEHNEVVLQPALELPPQTPFFPPLLNMATIPSQPMAYSIAQPICLSGG